MGDDISDVRFVFDGGAWLATNNICRSQLWTDPSNVLRRDITALKKPSWGWHSTVMTRTYPSQQCCGRLHGWVYLGSHNCSAASWGNLDLSMAMANWELGVLLLSPPRVVEGAKCGCDLSRVALPFNSQALRRFRSDRHPQPEQRSPVGTCKEFWTACGCSFPPGDLAIVNKLCSGTEVSLRICGSTGSSMEHRLTVDTWCQSGFRGSDWPPPRNALLFVEVTSGSVSWVCSKVLEEVKRQTS